MFKYRILLIFWGLCGVIHAQKDSSRTKIETIIGSSRDNPELKGTQIVSKMDSLLHPQLRIGGYISTYYAHYDDDTENNNFVQFPTLAPRKDQFSLNMALISLEYNSADVRGKITLHYGDIPESSWPATFNLIQEANGGFKIVKKLWFDAGFFKTHIGLGSFQPRENVTSSMSIPDFYDPYYLSGAKLTFLASPKLSLQASIFNGYNEYVDNNKNKAFGFSANYNANNHISFTYNFLTCDETPDAIKTKHQLFYNNFYATFIYSRFTLGLDLNFGIQQHSLKSDSTKNAMMYAGTLVAKYLVHKKLGIYARLEDFQDPEGILSSAVPIGDYIRGTTIGMEFNPYRTVGLSAEWRILESDHLIFRQGNTMLNQRNEFIVCLDLWF
ncbi:MAG: outer membrane beta-barrel protein [Bacteroidia bacterium]|nr:outer membrane beta-barrel protein [Bacteroidia bacterium]